MGAPDTYLSFPLERFLMYYSVLGYVSALCISQLTSFKTKQNNCIPQVKVSCRQQFKCGTAYQHRFTNILLYITMHGRRKSYTSVPRFRHKNKIRYTSNSKEERTKEKGIK